MVPFWSPRGLNEQVKACACTLHSSVTGLTAPCPRQLSKARCSLPLSNCQFRALMRVHFSPRRLAWRWGGELGACLNPGSAARSGVICAIETMGTGEQAGARLPQLVAALIIREAIPHRLFGRKTLCIGLAQIAAVLGTGVSVILPSLMIGIDQGIVGERQQTFSEAVEGVLLYASEHFRRCLLAGILTGFEI